MKLLIFEFFLFVYEFFFVKYIEVKKFKKFSIKFTNKNKIQRSIS